MYAIDCWSDGIHILLDRYFVEVMAFNIYCIATYVRIDRVHYAFLFRDGLSEVSTF